MVESKKIFPLISANNKSILLHHRAAFYSLVKEKPSFFLLRYTLEHFGSLSMVPLFSAPITVQFSLIHHACIGRHFHTKSTKTNQKNYVLASFIDNLELLFSIAFDTVAYDPIFLLLIPKKPLILATCSPTLQEESSKMGLE